jgi:hypothetical protein
VMLRSTGRNNHTICARDRETRAAPITESIVGFD